MDHLTLEYEIAQEKSPFSTGEIVTEAPCIRRETVLAMLSQAAQSAPSFTELSREAGLLAAAALELDSFAGTELLGKDRLRVCYGTLQNPSLPTRNEELPLDPAKSVFAFCMEAGHPILIPDTRLDRRFHDPWLDARGVRAAVVCPVSYREQRYGAIGYFQGTPREFAKEDVLFLQSVSLFLGPARAYQVIEQTLADHTHFLASTIDALEAVVVLLNQDGTIMQINRACQNLGGFTAAELRGRRIWNAFWPAEQVQEAERIFAELRRGTGQTRCESNLITKRGQHRRVSWTFSRIHSETGAGPCILASGIDVTDHVQTLRRLDELSRQTNNGGHEHSRSTTPLAPPNKLGEAVQRERRRHQRRAFRTMQMIAPCHNGILPTLDQFREVRCYDICTNGFSFLLNEHPPFQELVAAFGTEKNRLYLRSRIRHVTPIHFEGRDLLRIGCEYTSRVQIEASPS